jgi:hypothetical protein
VAEQRQAELIRKDRGRQAQRALADAFPGREAGMLSQTLLEAVEASAALFSPSLPASSGGRGASQDGIWPTRPLAGFLHNNGSVNVLPLNQTGNVLTKEHRHQGSQSRRRAF